MKVNGAAKQSFVYDNLQRVMHSLDAAVHADTSNYDTTTGNLATLKRDSSGQGWMRLFDRYGRDSVMQPGTTLGQYVADTILYDAMNRSVALHDGVHPIPDSTLLRCALFDQAEGCQGADVAIHTKCTGLEHLDH